MIQLERDECFTPNVLSLCIQPDEGIHLTYEPNSPARPRKALSRWNSLPLASAMARCRCLRTPADRRVTVKASLFTRRND